MAQQPRTERLQNDHGKNCLHMEDEDGAALLVHHRGDQPLGFFVEVHAIVPVRLPNGQVTHAEARIGTYLTQSQANELCGYFKDEL